MLFCIHQPWVGAEPNGMSFAASARPLPRSGRLHAGMLVASSIPASSNAVRGWWLPRAPGDVAIPCRPQPLPGLGIFFDRLL
eukprot:13461158-Alexandrium_andersonii.AAC.1